MKKRKWSVEKIISILKEAEAGISVTDLCRKHGMSDCAFYSWRKKYQGMEVSDAKRLRALSDENMKLKRVVANQVLEIEALKDVVSKNF
jgi:putative transposase